MSPEASLGCDAKSGRALAITPRRIDLWIKENKETIDSSNAFIEKHGLP
ncbi:type II toxin-antitoxin system CcdA family antitoxin [Allopusillimonas ginsengisoli]|nr:post-segregation antitoxin CcdA [Allopusillimonas ginsengisoli]